MVKTLELDNLREPCNQFEKVFSLIIEPILLKTNALIKKIHSEAVRPGTIRLGVSRKYSLAKFPLNHFY